MPYPYGMQNSPVVGNGLGGLPRRATATTATAATGARPYRLEQIASSTFSHGTVYQPSTMTPVIMNNGVITRFYQSASDSDIRKWTCTYSASGLGTATDTSLGTTTWDNTMLPAINNGKFLNFCWKKVISPTLSLYYYSGNILPFWVDTQYATPVHYVPTATSTGTYINGDGSYTSMTLFKGTAIIGKNGNLLILGVSSSTQRVAILEFNSADTSQVRVAWTGLTGGTNGAITLGRIRTHSFGYSILVTHASAGSATEQNMKLATMTNDLARITTRSAQTTEPNGTGNPRASTLVIGETSAYVLFSFGSVASTIYTKRMVMGISSTGALSGDSGSNTMPNIAFNGGVLRTNCPNYPFTDTMISLVGCITSNIDGTGHNGYMEYGNQYNAYPMFTLENQGLANYIDFDITPPNPAFGVERSCKSNLLALTTIDYGSSNIFAAGVAQDNDGYLFFDNIYGQSANSLYRKVYL